MFGISHLVVRAVQATAGVISNVVFGSPAAAPAAASAQPESTTVQESSNTSIIITESVQEASAPVAAMDSTSEHQAASIVQLATAAAPLSERNSTIDQSAAEHSSMACNSSSSSSNDDEDELFEDCSDSENDFICTGSSAHSSSVCDSGIDSSSNATAAASTEAAALHSTAAATASVCSAAESVESAPLQHQQLPESKRDNIYISTSSEPSSTAPSTPLLQALQVSGECFAAVEDCELPVQELAVHMSTDVVCAVAGAAAVVGAGTGTTAYYKNSSLLQVKTGLSAKRSITWKKSPIAMAMPSPQSTFSASSRYKSSFTSLHWYVLCYICNVFMYSVLTCLSAISVLSHCMLYYSRSASPVQRLLTPRQAPVQGLQSIPSAATATATAGTVVSNTTGSETSSRSGAICNSTTIEALFDGSTSASHASLEVPVMSDSHKGMAAVEDTITESVPVQVTITQDSSRYCSPTSLLPLHCISNTAQATYAQATTATDYQHH
jgi:hypothetical protein